MQKQNVLRFFTVKLIPCRYKNPKQMENLYRKWTIRKSVRYIQRRETKGRREKERTYIQRRETEGRKEIQAYMRQTFGLNAHVLGCTHFETHTHTHTHTYIHIHINTCMHTFIHTHACINTRHKHIM